MSAHLGALKALLATWKANDQNYVRQDVCAGELEAALREELEASRFLILVTVPEWLENVLNAPTLLEQFEKEKKAYFPGTPAALAWEKAIALLKSTKP